MLPLVNQKQSGTTWTISLNAHTYFTISYIEIPAISNCFSFASGVRVHHSGKYRSIQYMEISEMLTQNFGGMDRTNYVYIHK